MWLSNVFQRCDYSQGGPEFAAAREAAAISCDQDHGHGHGKCIQAKINHVCDLRKPSRNACNTQYSEIDKTIVLGRLD
jgi:hypothetical protein